MTHLHRIFLVITILLTLISSSCSAFSEDEPSRLLDDLLVVGYWNQKQNERLPVTYNHFLQGGYFIMPSARMGEEGEVSSGYSRTPPYNNYNIRCQLLDRLECSLNYRVFTGVPDPVFGHLGFGDFSDKGLNVKFSLFSAEDSKYQLPGVAIGFDDFIGTQAFNAHYIVMTQVILKYNLEASLGYGRHRIRGFFGGISWMPFRNFQNPYAEELSLTLEYDAIPYKDCKIERHPAGRIKKSPWNFGLKYRIWNSIDLSLSYIRGNAWALSASTYYNFGDTKGVVPKILDPLPYKAPINNQEIGCFRPEDALIRDLFYAFRKQGFELMQAWLTNDGPEQILRIYVINQAYREELFIRNRLNALLAGLVPVNIDRVIVVIAAMEVPIQEYRYNMKYVRNFQCWEMGAYELNILTPIHEVTYPNPYQSKMLFKKENKLWNAVLLPKTHFLFGSSRGKFKYALGLSLCFNGFILNDVFYSVSFGYFIFSNLYDVNDVDRLNPSQLINVRTDIVNYYKQKSITLDEAYMQKVVNMGDGCYARCGFGLFEPEYGGAVGEWLYYPVNSWWAVGIEGAVLKKRTPDSFGFTNQVRKLRHFHPTYVNFFGSQYFLNLYYDWKTISLRFKASAGKFLASDYGVRYEISRSFPSGFNIGFWYTQTNAHDYINGQRYQDKGFYVSLPLDIFYTKSSRVRWGYGMSAWLRDIGARAYTGPNLYHIINENRQ
jgi:hypothetical protein